MGRRISVISAGDHWEKIHTLRPAVEDLIGVGAILVYNLGDKSPTAMAHQRVADVWLDDKFECRFDFPGWVFSPRLNQLRILPTEGVPVDTFTLVIGDKNLSSWSMRPWLSAKAAGLTFREILIPLDQPETKSEILKYSSSGRVPCLIHGDLVVWDSLAICEYIAEQAPNINLWPSDTNSRAKARSYVSEMHAGFPDLRTQLSMDIRLRIEIRHLTPGTIQDIKRILYLWNDALSKSNGPFLFGEFGIADAFFAPVVCRFRSYGISIESHRIGKYMDAIETYSHVKEWIEAAKKERPRPLSFDVN